MGRCIVLRDGDSIAFICGVRTTPRKCAECHRASVALCDYEIKPGKTCDRRMCGQHRTPVGPDVDHCTHHKNALPVNSLPLEMNP